MDTIHRHFAEGFEAAVAERTWTGRRIGAELKFPLVNADGSAVELGTIDALWEYLRGRGWEPVVDSMTGNVIGARTAGELNDTVASCETGYPKTEFSLAHVGDLNELVQAVADLKATLAPFAERHDVHFLGYGIHPVTPPSERLMMKRGRTSVWDKVFGANRILDPADGDDVCLFTVNAASHVHVSVDPDESIGAVNALNGYSAAQIALTADSNIWRGSEDDEFKCVAEKLWDWWIPEPGRVGVPDKPFADLQDYVETVASFKPVYVKRNGQPIVLPDYDSFAEYYTASKAVGRDLDGDKVELTPEPADVDLHSTCYWYNARLSHYFTVENRVNDQQPPEELETIAALTLGLVTAARECEEALKRYDWSTLKGARDAACRDGLDGEVDGLSLRDLAGEMLDLAARGLDQRGCGEQRLLQPLRDRLAAGRCPADDAGDVFRDGGIDALIENRTLRD